MSVFATGQNIYMRKGDTGNISFNGLPTDKSYNAYLSIYDEENSRILAEISTIVNNGSATFTLTESFSNSLPVGDWVYGLKITAMVEGLVMEDTVLPRTYIDDNGKLVNEPAPTFTVDEKYVKGENE